MPKVSLPDGSVLVGHKADEYIKNQKKAEKELKKELKAEVKDALRMGCGAAAKAAKAELKAASSPATKAEMEAAKAAAAAAAILADPELFQTEVLREIRTNPIHLYCFKSITRKADVEGVDKERVKEYMKHASKDADVNNLFISVFHDEAATYNGSSTLTHVLEVHPALRTVEIPIGAVVAVERFHTAYRICAIDK
jgi:hypothetical protein